MNNTERRAEWVRFYKASSLHYNMNALLAVLENDGPEMLDAVLKDLGLLRSSDLVKDAARKGGGWVERKESSTKA